MIPLCHPLPLSHVDSTLRRPRDGYDIEARVRTTAQTGVEMEALHGRGRRGADDLRHGQGDRQGMIIGDIRLVEKRGGKGGDFLGDPRRTILVGIYSPFTAWNIPGPRRSHARDLP